MTQEGLKELKKIATEVDELREKASGLMVHLTDLYQVEENLENIEAHDSLTKATVSLQKAAWRLGHAIEEMQRAYEYEKALMDYYEGLSNKLYDDEE